MDVTKKQEFELERLSVDLSNYCSKSCDFCYNKSNTHGIINWQPDEVIQLATDCAKNGLKAISLGGGEPFEYDGVYKVITALTPILFVSITSNGLPLLSENKFQKLLENKPDKIHLTIHQPDDENENRKTIDLLRKIKQHEIKVGINVLVSANKISETKKLVQYLYLSGYSENQIIFVPRKYTQIPTTKQVAEVAGSPYFQSATCLTDCTKSKRFCSISWDKKVNYCSFSTGKMSLKELSYNGVIEALSKIDSLSCVNTC